MRQDSHCRRNTRKSAWLLVFVFLALVASGPDLWAAAGEKDPDEAALLKARKTGVDLSQPHKILCTLILPLRVSAQAISHLKQRGFNAQGWITDGHDRVLFAAKTMVPEAAALQSIRRDIDGIIASLLDQFERGSYQGWEIIDTTPSGEDDPDEIALLKAQHAGINLTRPHEIQFHLRVPESDLVTYSTLTNEGFTTNTTGSDDHQFFVLAARRMVPELATLQKVRRDLNSLIAALPGENKKGAYDGWLISNYKPLDYIQATGLWTQAGRIFLFTHRGYPCAFEEPPGGNEQMFVSTDDGHSWKKGGPGLDGNEFRFISEKDGKVWIVGDHYVEGPTDDPFILIPAENGDKWQMRTVLKDYAAVDRVAWGSKGELFAWLMYANLRDLTYGPAYIHQSLDGGRTWKSLGPASSHKVEVVEEFRKISTHADPLWRTVNSDFDSRGAVQHRESEAAPWKTVWRSPTPPCQY